MMILFFLFPLHARSSNDTKCTNTKIWLQIIVFAHDFKVLRLDKVLHNQGMTILLLWS